MKTDSYTTSFVVDQTPAQVFEAINNVRGWWSEDVDGLTDKAGATFKYRYRDIHRCEIRVEELVPGEKVVWHVVDNYFSFTKDESEWKGTDMVFEIARRGDKTEVKLTHVGLNPDHECYDACSDGWHTYINGSLKALIATGKGRPNVGEPKTDSEQSLSRIKKAS
jgi:hypothetical protein